MNIKERFGQKRYLKLNSSVYLNYREIGKNTMNNYCRKTIYIALVIGLLSASSILHADEQSTFSSTITGTTKEYLSDPARTGSLVGSIIAASALANPLAPVLGSVIGFVIGKSSAFSKKKRNSANENVYNNRSLMPAEGTELTSLTGLSGTSSLATVQEDGVANLSNVDPRTPEKSLRIDGNTVAGNEVTNVPDLKAAQPTMPDESSTGIVIVEEIDQPQIGITVDTIVPIEIVREAALGIDTIQTSTNGLRMETAGDSDLQKRLADACSNYKTVKTASLNCYYYAQ